MALSCLVCEITFSSRVGKLHSLSKINKCSLTKMFNLIFHIKIQANFFDLNLYLFFSFRGHSKSTYAL